MLAPTLLVMGLAAAMGDVSHLVDGQGGDHSSTTEAAPHRPYVFSYTAGRYPGHTDRHHAEVSDGSGVVRGTFSYVDPRNHVRTVDYVADKEGFHPVLSDPPPEHPRATAAVAAAAHRHHQLYAEIAEDHAANPHPQELSLPRQSAAVAAATARHADLFRVIAEQHARIAAERELLQQQDLGHELDEHEHEHYVPHDLQHLQH